MTGAHIDGTPATVEDAQTPVMNPYEELTEQLGGPSGIAVAVPGISSHDLAAQRTSHHKNAEVFVGANGEVDSLRIGTRGSSARTGTFLRVYDKHLPAHAGVAGVRAEIEVSRPGYLAAVEQIKIGSPREGPRARPGAALGRQGAHHRIQAIPPSPRCLVGARAALAQGTPPRASSSITPQTRA